MRLFFALDISQEDKEQLDDWRQHILAPLFCSSSFKIIQKENFHITLSFLGIIQPAQLVPLQQQADVLASQLINTPQYQHRTVTLNTLGHFKQPKVLYLGLTNTPEWLTNMANSLKQAALAQHIFQEERPYCPHLSLYRKATHLPQVHIESKTVAIKSFSLYSSISEAGGVIYTPIKTWCI